MTEKKTIIVQLTTGVIVVFIDAYDKEQSPLLVYTSSM